MEFWHSTKVNKYLALNTTIEFKSVEVFAVEVGARGYCSKCVFCCIKKLGFNNTLIGSNINKLSKSSMGCFFFYLTG